MKISFSISILPVEKRFWGFKIISLIVLVMAYGLTYYLTNNNYAAGIVTTAASVVVIAFEYKSDFYSLLKLTFFLEGIFFMFCSTLIVENFAPFFTAILISTLYLAIGANETKEIPISNKITAFILQLIFLGLGFYINQHVQIIWR